ncbi:hypothetical protein AOQ84DRAFT_93056 [Glonium stellatum]|uniref:Uncharacterized protein n=1 Tax=Glonium stellatum TaxID=574774 RepID=A0A8E2JQF2_9PEZI|nr:hypothetical protein AOQ84DRAFT_93056 [Glonium stellatum]
MLYATVCLAISNAYCTKALRLVLPKLSPALTPHPSPLLPATTHHSPLFCEISDSAPGALSTRVLGSFPHAISAEIFTRLRWCLFSHVLYFQT